jgi:hypothetical protein
MLIISHHLTLLGITPDGNGISQVNGDQLIEGELVSLDDDLVLEIQKRSSGPGKRSYTFEDGILKGYNYVQAAAPGCFHLEKGRKYLSAGPNLARLVCDRGRASGWETFSFVNRSEAERHLAIHQRREQAFGHRVGELIAANQPVCLHFGCGPRRLPGFLNIDKTINVGDPLSVSLQRPTDDYFIFSFTEMPWPIPDGSVDYIYSEDFIEHISQKNQVAYLAESFRVLKFGAINRINTPCLVDSMKKNSDFSKGFHGVYFGEFDRWAHIALFTRGFCKDLANAIGYRQVFFTAKSRGSSPFSVNDVRPGDDRDDLTGNIFADLVK